MKKGMIGSLVSLSEMLPMMIPSDFPEAGIYMLTGYFDDSGTDPKSDMVVWAGLFGNQYQWAALDDAWAKKLKTPCLGKEPISCFHMVDCEHGRGEFLHWKRLEREYLSRELADIITANLLYGYVIGVARKDYDADVQGISRKILGDAEGFCIYSCYRSALNWAMRRASYDDQISFVLDDRPHRSAIHKGVFSAFQEINRIDRAAWTPKSSSERPKEIISLTFSSARRFRALQAADLLAYEAYHNLLGVIKGSGFSEPKRPNLRRLISNNRMTAEIVTRTEIQLSAPSDLEEKLKLLPPTWPY